MNETLKEMENTIEAKDNTIKECNKSLNSLRAHFDDTERALKAARLLLAKKDREIASLHYQLEQYKQQQQPSKQLPKSSKAIFITTSNGESSQLIKKEEQKIMNDDDDDGNESKQAIVAMKQQPIKPMKQPSKAIFITASNGESSQLIKKEERSKNYER
eukprot:TRINITY_DN19862_c0_g1_i2.p1 TRINITY_DN19862_c0_g1~~TRINITY_DN19862_c0_g1_i2.p1  ORF type:complete len:159 (-),score=54.68 TRINITY_DN19862_c0_g1_i2:182-658(-)